MTEAEAFSISAGQIEADPEITRLLGIFVARWSLAEFSLMLALMVALGSGDQEVATTLLASTPSAEAKIKIVLKTLDVAKQSKDLRDAIKKAVKVLDKLCPERNALLHHLWGRRTTGETITQNYREPDPAKAQTVRTVESLKALCNAVVDAACGTSTASGSSWINATDAKRLKI